MTVILVVLAVWFCRRALRMTPASRFELVLLPVFAAVMLALSMEWGVRSVAELVGLLAVAAGIGWFQARGLEFQDADVSDGTGSTDNHGRPVVRMRRTWRYVAGWVAVFAIGIVCEAAAAHGAAPSGEEVGAELQAELLRDLLPWVQFAGGKREWFLWALTAGSALAFTASAVHQHPRLRQAIGRRRRK